MALPLPPGVRHRLQCAGFRTTADLAAVAGPVELATGESRASGGSAVGLCGPPTLRTSAAPEREELVAPAAQHPLGATRSATLSATLPTTLPAEAQLTHEEALLALKLAAPHRVAGGGAGGDAAASVAVSARQIAERERAAKPIITFAPELDRILGGGVEAGAITEFWWVLDDSWVTAA